MGYPAPFKRKPWRVQIEFLNGVVIDAVDDADAIERWRRLASWTDDLAVTDPAAWLDRVLDRARTFYGARFIGVHSGIDSRLVLDALAAEGCITLRRQ